MTERTELSPLVLEEIITARRDRRDVDGNCPPAAVASSALLRSMYSMHVIHGFGLWLSGIMGNLPQISS